MTTINNAVNKYVTLGSNGYTSPLTITSTGQINGPQAVTADQMIGNAGQSALLMASGMVSNAGFIDGGQGSNINYPGSGTDGAGATALVMQGGVLLNTGYIQGGAGGSGNQRSSKYEVNGGAGGAGAVLSGGTLINDGYIAGGVGGGGKKGGTNGAGGFGVLINGGTVVNNGTIAGPQDGVRINDGVFIDNGIITNKYQIVTYNYGGGNPTLLFESGATITNKLFAHGETSTLGVTGSTPFTLSDASGFWQNFVAFTFASNTGGFALTGAASVFDGGEAISGLIGGDRLTLTGFAATSESFASANDLVLENSANAAVTLDLTGFTSTGQLKFSNDGSNTTLTGLTGTISTAISPGITLGAGSYSSTLLITDTGAVTGGGGSAGTNGMPGSAPTGGGAGGIALAAGSGGGIVNQGLLTGGAGGAGGYSEEGGVAGAAGGAGASGASLTGAGLSNSGIIAGGAGGAGGHGTKSFTQGILGSAGGGGGNGGAGLILASGTGTNQLLITGGIGGAGGTGGYYAGRVVGYYSGGGGGAGGAGLSLSNAAVFTNSGTITGGGGGLGGLNGSFAGQRGRASSGAQGAGASVNGGTLVNAGTISGSNAVVLGANVGTLVVESGAVFNGNILANSAVADVLEFAGSSATEFSGIGTSTEGFTDISFAAGAAWTLEGNISGLASGQSITGFAAGDRIILDNVAAASETLNAGKLTLGGAVLALGASSDNFVVVDNGTNSTLAVAPASISLAAGSTDIISGHAAGLTASSITGFAAGDTIDLEGFAATSESYVSGVGLVLGNGTTFDTLAVNSFSGFFADRTDGANTTIFARAPVSIISTAIGSSGVPSYVTLANGMYASALTLTATGVVGYGSNRYAPMSYRGFLPGKIDIYAASGLGGVSLTNLGVIDEADTGVEFLSAGYVKNSNLISTNHDGIVLKAGGTIVNSGNIKAFGYFGIKLQAGGTVINSGYINGGDGGIYSGQGLTLIEAPGAAFGNGGRHSVEVKQGYYGTLELTGTFSQNISNFAGISNIIFAQGAAWDIAIQPYQNYFDGVTITGFGGGDQLTLDFFTATYEHLSAGNLIVGSKAGAQVFDLGASTDAFVVVDDGTNSTLSVNPSTLDLGGSGSFYVFGQGLGAVASRLTLDGFAATSETENAAGITLSNGATVVNIAAPPSGEVASFTAGGGDTTLTFLIGTISTSLAAGITLNAATYANPLTVSSTGTIPGLAGSVAVTALLDDSLTNQGQLAGGAGTAGLYNYNLGGPGMAGGDGLDGLSSAMLTNTGSITGGAGGAGGSSHYMPGVAGQGGDGLGVALNASITNSGTILGGAGGAGGFGYRETSPAGGTGGSGIATSGSGTIANTASIGGGGGGTGGDTHTAAGGAGGAGGIGIASTGFESIANAGTITGGAGDTGGAPNIGGEPDGAGGAGGAAIQVAGSYLNNSGLIDGGAGGRSANHAGDGTNGAGGSGIAGSGAQTIVNTGTIAGGAGGTDGGGQNDDSAGGGNGGTAIASTGSVEIFNQATIAGGAGAAAGTESNFEPGTGGGAIQAAAGLIDNTGIIQGGAGGAPDYYGGGNGAGGVAVSLGGGTLINAGTIEGGSGADAVDFGADAATLIVQAGASFIGNVTANAGAPDTLEFTGTSATAFTGLGSAVLNFSTIDFALGTAWTIGGSTAGLATGQTITGFLAGDTIDLAGISAATETFANGVLTLASDTGAVLASLLLNEPAGLAGTNYFALNPDGNGGTEITSDVQCFAAGTRILTPAGEVPVEALRVGDRVVTVRDGGMLTRRIVWTGQQRIHLARQPEPQLLRPVCIRAGALAAGLPERDLRLSPHHAVYLDGKLFEAISLVNGMTIFQEEGNGWVSYHHIELDAHDIVLAEGCPCESYLDTGSRHLFGRELFPDFRAPAGAAFCAPLIREGAALAAARQAINTRAARYNKAA